LDYYVYILSSKNHRVLYVGVTKNIVKRVYEHKQGFVEGFTKKYNVKRLVYYEVFDNIENAIAREKQLKAGSRHAKELLIETNNPEWDDLYSKITE